MENNEQTSKAEGIALDSIGLDDLGSTADTEVNESTNNKDKIIQEPIFPEFAEIDIPNHFSMKLGSYSLQSDQLVSIILGCYKKLDLNCKKKRGNSYT